MESNINLRLLFVEDLETDQILAEREIKKAGIEFTSLRVETEKDFIYQLENFDPNFIISDYSMPEFDGMSALKIALKTKPNIPFLILTGSMNEETAVECMKAGADDYVIKENLHRLIPAIISALKKYENLHAKEKAEQSLLESEQRFKSIFTDSLAAMLLIDPDTRRIIDANKAAENFYGWSKEELTKKKVDDINTLSPDELQKEMQKAVTQQRVHFEFKHRRADGSVRDVEIFASMINFKGKSQLHSIIHDITERKGAEEALKTSDRVFRHSIDMLCVAGFDGYFKVLNPSWQRVLGWTTNELLSKPWVDFVYEADKHSTENIKSTIVNGQEIYQFENRYICKDGSVKWLSWNTFPYPNEGIMFGVARDVTEKKKSEEQLRTLSRAVEQSPVSIIITDPKGAIEYINPKLTDVTGYELEDVIGKTPSVFKSGLHNDDFYEDLWKTILSGRRWQGEIQNKKKNGEIVWENAIISPIVDTDGNIINFVAVKEDISELKKIMKDLVNAKEMAERADQLKTEFLAQMSHEIRSPLNAVLSFTSLVEEEVAESIDEELKMAFGGIRSASQRIIRTIDLILNMSELQLGTYNMTVSEIDLIDLLKRLVNEYEWPAQSKGIDLVFESDTESARITSDEYALNQMIINLVDNAIKYTKEGSVSLRLISNEKKNCIIEIADTGIGISEEYLPDVFTPFSQEEQGYSRRYDGTGLGMALVKKYCDIIGAKLTIESEKNVGTKIRIELDGMR